jgi:hypothetical protein
LYDGVVRVVVKLHEVGPVGVGKVGDLGEVVWIMVEITEDEYGVVLE